MPYADYEKHKQKVKERYWANREKIAEQSRVYRAKNKDKVIANRKAYFEANKEAIRERDRSPKRRADANKAFKVRYPHRTDEDKQRALLRIIKKRALDRGISFNLEHSKIVWPTHCPVFGTPLVYGQRAAEGDWAHGASIDRLVPSRGYVLDNIVVMSWRANRIKCDATLEDLEKLVAFLRMLRPTKES